LAEENRSGLIEDGVSLRYIALDTMQKFGMSPLDWEKLNKKQQLELIAKRQLDIKQENHIKKKMKEMKEG